MNLRHSKIYIPLLLITLLMNATSALAQEKTFGGTGNPSQITALVSNAIKDKNLPYTPPRYPLLRSEGASTLWSNVSGQWDERGTFSQITLSKTCEILGYETYVRSTCRDNERSHRYPNGKCNFHSPSNNELARFAGAGFGWETALHKYNKTWIASITCKDPIQDDPPQECTPNTETRVHPQQTACSTGQGGTCEAGTLVQTCGSDGQWPPLNAGASNPLVECVAPSNCQPDTGQCVQTLDYDASPPVSMSSEYWIYCNDGIDNDCDGSVDCADSDCPSCSGDPVTPTPTPHVDEECAVNLVSAKDEMEATLNRIGELSVTALNAARVPVRNRLNADTSGYSIRALQRALKNINRAINKTNGNIDAGINLIRSFPAIADTCVDSCNPVRDLLEDAESIGIKGFLQVRRTRAGIKKSLRGLSKHGSRYNMPAGLRTKLKNVRDALEALEVLLDELPDESCQ